MLTTILIAEFHGFDHSKETRSNTSQENLDNYIVAVHQLVSEHHGEILGNVGDKLAAHFENASDAVRCALAIEVTIQTSGETANGRSTRTRVGIDQGKVIVEAGRVSGPGLKAATAILNSLTDGGIYVSGAVEKQIKNLHQIEVEKHGEGVDAIYRIRPKTVPDAASLAPNVAKRVWRNAALAAGIAVVLVIMAAVTWQGRFTYEFEPADIAKYKFELPEEPSLAVMPFDNLSGDEEQDYLADGIVDAIITALTEAEQLFVVARNSTFTYKGKPYLVKDVAEALGVRHLLEGSFQRTGDTVRVTARLVDALDGRQIWGGSFDREMSDIFALQDDITTKIVEELQIKLTVGEQGRVWRRGTSNAKAYQLILKARSHIYRFTPEANARALELVEQALSLDPEYALAEATRSFIYWMDGYNGWAQEPVLALKQSLASAKKAIAMDDTDAWLHRRLAFIYITFGERDKAFAALEKAETLNSGRADGTQIHAHVFVMDGRQPEEAIKWFNRSLRLNPNKSILDYWILSEAFRQLGRYEEMIEVASNILDKFPEFWWERPRLVYAHMKLGRETEARAMMKEWLAKHPKSGAAYLAAIRTFPKPLYDDTVDTLVRAGFPDPSKPND